MIQGLTTLSREYLVTPVTVRGVDASLLTTLPVEFAFVAEDAQPAGGDWIAGDWEPVTNNARILIGPSTSAVLGAGTYSVWLRVTGAIIEPVRKLDTLVIG